MAALGPGQSAGEIAKGFLELLQKSFCPFLLSFVLVRILAWTSHLPISRSHLFPCFLLAGIFFLLSQSTACATLTRKQSVVFIVPILSSSQHTMLSLWVHTFGISGSEGGSYTFVSRKEQREISPAPGLSLSLLLPFLQMKPIWTQFLCAASSSSQPQS